MEFKEKAEIIPLIIKCRDGYDSAFEELVALYRPMINGVIHHFSLNADEAFSEACIGFYRAVMSYDLEQSKVTFGLYAKICTERCVIDMLRREGRDVSSYIDDGIDVDSIAVSGGIQSMLENREQMAYFLSLNKEGVEQIQRNLIKRKDLPRRSVQCISSAHRIELCVIGKQIDLCCLLVKIFVAKNG